jgi:hypothetical protein
LITSPHLRSFHSGYRWAELCQSNLDAALDRVEVVSNSRHLASIHRNILTRWHPARVMAMPFFTLASRSVKKMAREEVAKSIEARLVRARLG